MNELFSSHDTLEHLPTDDLQALSAIWSELLEAGPDQQASSRMLQAQIRLLLEQEHYDEALARLEELFNIAHNPRCLHWLALVSRASGDPDAARAWLLKEQDFLPLFDARARAANAWELAQLALQQDQLVPAIGWLRTCLLQSRFGGDTHREALTRRLLGDLSLRRQRPDLASEHYEAARTAYLRAGDDRGVMSIDALLASLPQAGAHAERKAV